MIAEELARRASLDWVKQQARVAEAHNAEDAAHEVRVHPLIAGAVAAAIGGASIFALIRRRQHARAAKRPVLMLPRIPELPRLSKLHAHAPRFVKRTPTKAQRALDAFREGGHDALAALHRAQIKKAWVDRFLAPAIGMAVVVGGIAAAIMQIRAAKPVDPFDPR